MPHAWPIIEILILLALANGSPIAAKRMMKDRFAFPVDGGLVFIDGRPFLGRSKTVRGIVVAIVLTTLAAMLMGESWALGLAVGAASMAGDLLSSFVKRRLGLAPSAQATGLDQIPEALVPALVAMPLLGLNWFDVVAIVALFCAGGIVLSRWLFRLGVRDQPY